MPHASCFPAPRGRDPAIQQEVRPLGAPPPTSRRALSALASPWRAANAPLAASGRFPPSFPSKMLGHNSVLPASPLAPGGLHLPSG